MLCISSMRNMTLDRMFFFFNDTATTEIYTLSLHDALPISEELVVFGDAVGAGGGAGFYLPGVGRDREVGDRRVLGLPAEIGRATPLNSSHANISYAVFCLKKKNTLTYHSCSNSNI